MPSTTRSDGARPARPAYHHGALRTALLDGAREMLVERGPDGFSLSALARRVGVSTAAPYRHFADRDALLCALADEGYVAFGAALDAAVRASSGPRDRLRRLGIAYLRYAAENPAVFAIMFTARLGGTSEVGPPTFRPLVQAVVDAQASGDLPADEPTAAIARTLWASLHGLAVLGERGGLAKLGLDDTPERLVDDLLALALR